MKKLLITSNAVHYSETDVIKRLLNEGKTMAEVQEITGMHYSTIWTYLPYRKVVYKMEEISRNAERVETYRERKKAVEILHSRIEDGSTEEAELALWNCVITFQNYPFHTSSGLPFTYTLKIGKDGKYTNELIVSRKEGGKTLTRSSVMLAFHKVLEQKGAVFTGPKAIGQIFGISYIYSLFGRFEIIAVPEKVEEKLRGKRGKPSMQD